MAETVNRGPTVNVGSLMDGRLEAFDGPSIEYQGVVVPDVRFSPMAKDGLAPARVKGFFSSSNFVVVDAIPSNTSTTTVAAAQAPSSTTGTLLLLATGFVGTAAGVPVFSPGIPIIPVGTTKVVTVSAIDFGFATGTTTAASSTVVVVDNTQFTLGQWIVIAGAGSAGATNVALICQVASIATANTTTITVSPVAATGLANAPIGQGNLYSQFLPPATQFGPSAASASAAEPYRAVGLACVLDPAQAVCRNITVTAATITAGTGTFLVSGYDLYGVPMTELLTASGTTTVAGKKAFKYVNTIASQTVPAAGANVNFGTGDVVGLAMRSDKWEYLDVFFNGGFAINNTGWTAAVTTLATNTTGDVRGTQNCSTVLVGGTGGTAVAGGGLNGVKRLTIVEAIPQQAMINANPVNYTSLFGVTQA